MRIIYILLGIVIVTALMDEVKFRYGRIFGRFLKGWWFDPHIKTSALPEIIYRNKFLVFLFGTMLIWTIDFWHFLKLIQMTLIVSIPVVIYSMEWWWIIVGVFLFGFIEEFIWIIFANISDWIN